jgi:hypothetical protein
MELDIDRIKRQVDLLLLIERDTDLKHVARTKGGEYSGPCPFCGGRDRFRVQPYAPGGGRWFCRQCTGEPGSAARWLDAIHYIRKRDKVGFWEACKRLYGTGPLPFRAKIKRRPQPEAYTPKPPPSAWQEVARELIDDCHQTLLQGIEYLQDENLTAASTTQDKLSTAPAAARAAFWLHRRGLNLQTMVEAHLGYNPEWRSVPGDSWLAPGITIPCQISDAIWYVNVRVSPGDAGRIGKYHALRGSVLSTLFGADSLLDANFAVVVEGEFDALLLRQEVGDMVAVVTMGSAATSPGPWATYFEHLNGLFIFLDRDEAGERGLARWEGLAQPIPAWFESGGDVTDFHRAGRDLRTWVRNALMQTEEADELRTLEKTFLEGKLKGTTNWTEYLSRYRELRELMGSAYEPSVQAGHFVVKPASEHPQKWELYYDEAPIMELNSQQAEAAMVGRYDPMFLSRGYLVAL